MSGALPSLSTCAILLSTQSRVWHPVTAATFLHLDASTRLITRSYSGCLRYRISHNLPFGCLEASKHVDQIRRYEIRPHSMLMKFILRIRSFYAQTILCFARRSEDCTRREAAHTVGPRSQLHYEIVRAQAA